MANILKIAHLRKNDIELKFIDKIESNTIYVFNYLMNLIKG